MAPIRRILRIAVLGVLSIGLLAMSFYVVENWRGKRAWEICKAKLEAKGEKLNWDAFVPEPIADDQNFLKAPVIQAVLFRSSAATNQYKAIKVPEIGWVTGKELAEWKAYFKNEPTASPDRPCAGHSDEAMPLIVIDDAPLPDAIRNLARQAQVDVQFDPNVLPRLFDVPVFLQLTNQTALQGLENLLRENRLTLRCETNSSIALITERIPSAADIVSDFKDFQAETTALYEACDRPLSWHDLDYRKLFDNEPVMPNYLGVRLTAHALALNSSAALVFDDTETALRDLRIMFRIAEATRHFPSLVSAMIDAAIVRIALEPIGLGVRSHKWRVEELLSIQKQLETTRLLPLFLRGLRVDRTGTLYAIDTLSRQRLSEIYITSFSKPLTFDDRVKRLVILTCPRGWLDQNKVRASTAIQQVVDATAAASDRISVKDLHATQNEVDVDFAPFNYFTVNFSKAAKSAVQNQSHVNLMFIACALERHRLAHAEYPETLSALVPQFAEKLPHDIVTGDPLEYRRTPDGRFQLYSVGWDGKDDGGDDETDWVWFSPPK